MLKKIWRNNRLIVSYLKKDIHVQIHEAEWIPNRINTNKSVSKYIVIETTEN